MPLYQIKDHHTTLVKSQNFNSERDLQKLIEENLESIFSCRFVATEFSTGTQHAGRIDTLALSEDNNPVIIEYKKVESSELINQSLFYLSWIKDHKGDFQVTVNKALKSEIPIDWSDIRVICIAPGYKKYDIHAVQMMGASIELWQYKLFENNSLYLEEIFRRITTNSENRSEETYGKNPIMIEAGKKAALTRATGIYNVEEHVDGLREDFKEIFEELRDYILSLDPAIIESPKKFYIAYKLNKNFVCVEIKTNKIILFLKLNPEGLTQFPKNGRDVRSIGHYGTGDFEYTLSLKTDIDEAKHFIRMSLEEIGG